MIDRRKELKDLQREHHDVLKRVGRLRSLYYQSRIRLRKKDRLIGMYNSVECPLPPIFITSIYDAREEYVA